MKEIYPCGALQVLNINTRDKSSNLQHQKRCGVFRVNQQLSAGISDEEQLSFSETVQK